ncbi:hypothetical protein [Peribacillus frigoritolerans]|uniref:hypothetical protein n=1 Tax=Peribacillus frigoritolerans TaxID=450367 RepID=UPI00215B2F19|nr:hypothetical protein [Peribacillus frigoritolerans]MCR8871025.1 hypothetical protein [Peribacillus frigoritolerans]
MVKFKEFREVDICNQRSNIGYCFFFCPKEVPFAPHLKRYIHYQGDTYDSNYSYWIGCT